MRNSNVMLIFLIIRELEDEAKSLLGALELNELMFELAGIVWKSSKVQLSQIEPENGLRLKGQGTAIGLHY